MKAPLYLILAAGAVGMLGTSCLERGGGAGDAPRQELAVKVGDLEAEVAALKAKLAAADAAKGTAETELAQVKTATERRVVEASRKAGEDLAAAKKELTALRDQMRKTEADHAAQVADLQQQIKAMALKVPAGNSGTAPVQPGTRTPATGGGIERRIGGGQ